MDSTVWIALLLGMLVRWTQRALHIIGARPRRTLKDYILRNYMRLILRAASNCAVFYYLIPGEWVIAPPVAFALGLSQDTLIEEVVNLGKRQGEAMIEKIKNGSHRLIIILLAVVLLSAATAAGCGPRRVTAPVAWGLTSEQIARGVYEKFTSFLRQAQRNHPECSADQPGAREGICPALQQAIVVQGRLADAINVYCSGLPRDGQAHYDAGGPCSPVLGAEPNLHAIIAEALNQMAQHAPDFLRGEKR